MPDYVFFREEPMRDPGVGPRGAQGVPLTPGRSVAVDRASIPYGTALWMDGGDAGTRRLVMAQDTGGGIVGRGAGRLLHRLGSGGRKPRR